MALDFMSCELSVVVLLLYSRHRGVCMSVTSGSLISARGLLSVMFHAVIGARTSRSFDLMLRIRLLMSQGFACVADAVVG